MTTGEILTSEGYSPVTLKPWIWKGDTLLNACQTLFRGFIFQDDDPRWAIVSKFVEVQRLKKFNGTSIENALQAIYLSPHPSYRRGYSSFNSEPAIRQLCRAIKNLEAITWLDGCFCPGNLAACMDFSDRANLRFNITDSIKLGTNKEGVTGCPEALYQLQLMYDGRYIGRVGLNVHNEEFINIISIANLQGIQDGTEVYEYFREYYGNSPFNLLIRAVKQLTQCDEGVSVVRGLKNPKHQESDRLYNTVFKHERVRRLSFRRDKID